mmetsp:Transcript_141499/g.359393  ORF Transcript_141499/g.359393 Transcript_141499/m.359393 type:complete len:286 (-) Transcript_141499:159-1016(-)
MKNGKVADEGACSYKASAVHLAALPYDCGVSNDRSAMDLSAMADLGSGTYAASPMKIASFANNCTLPNGRTSMEYTATADVGIGLHRTTTMQDGPSLDDDARTYETTSSDLRISADVSLPTRCRVTLCVLPLPMEMPWPSAAAAMHRHAHCIRHLHWEGWPMRFGIGRCDWDSHNNSLHRKWLGNRTMWLMTCTWLELRTQARRVDAARHVVTWAERRSTRFKSRAIRRHVRTLKLHRACRNILACRHLAAGGVSLQRDRSITCGEVHDWRSLHNDFQHRCIPCG